MGALPSHEENVIARVNEVVVAEGFYEIFTDSFYGRGMRERLGLAKGDPLWAHVEMQNSIEKNYSLLRNNTIGQALDALAVNVNLKSANVKMFEWARVYFPDLTERSIVWALANGRAADSIFLKGILEQLRLELRVELEIGGSDGHRLERFFHPGRRAGIRRGETLVGIFGELHPSLVARFDIKRQRPVYLEIDTDALFATPRPRVYTEPPSRQPIVRSVAFALPPGVTAAQVIAELRAPAPPFLRDIRVVDLFELPEARAVTFEIEFLSNEAVTGEAINEHVAVMTALATMRLPITQRT
jgi:phenylalanyl-tRNA synthetase beta chain